MQVRFTFKTPDVVEETINEAGLTDAEQGKMRKLAAKFFQWGEYATIELDTDKGTAAVIQVNK